MSLEGESSPLQNMLNQIKSMMKLDYNNLSDGEMNLAKISVKDLVKEMMKGINAPVYADNSNYGDKEQILAYIGNGFSIDIMEGEIVFEVDKMLLDIEKAESMQKKQEKVREDYKRAMGLVKGSLGKLRESLTNDINEAGGLIEAIKEINGVNNLKKSVLKQICEDSNMMPKAYGKIDAASVKKCLG